MDLENTQNLESGELISIKGKEYQVRSLIDLENIVLEDVKSGSLITRKVSFVLNNMVDHNENYDPISRDLDYTQEQFEEAKRKFEIILPLLNKKKSVNDVKLLSDKHKTSVNTIYRWIRKVSVTGGVEALIENRGKSNKGQLRIPKKVENIINICIEKHYLKSQRKRVRTVIRKVKELCKKEKLTPPHDNTVYARVRDYNNQEKLKKRYGNKLAKETYDPKTGNFKASFPLEVVQIDHTKVDVILVDDEHRMAIGRPWITVAIDIYSRVILGFYLSFDAPSTLAVGICLSHSIISKEKWMFDLGLEGSWPCWGIPSIIHVDNAKEFRGNDLRNSCAMYGININWRPVTKPNWGGHIERLIGTFSNEIHELPGTTFSNSKEKGEYKSEKKSALTLSEFEKWLTTYIVDVYHKREHSSLNRSPISAFERGILGENGEGGIGLPPIPLDAMKVKLDFYPSFSRTIQDYGIQFKNITYYHEILKKWINSIERNSGKAHVKRKFLFKYDPRDLSHIYFYEPDLKEYYSIPYADLSRPKISLWEYRNVYRKLKEEGREEINEDLIFAGYNKMEEIERKAVESTKKKRATAKKKGRKSNSDHIEVLNSKENKTSNIPSNDSFTGDINFDNIKPFD